MNEVQKILTEALELLGPNGEHWCRVGIDCAEGKFCAITAIDWAEKILGSNWEVSTEAANALALAVYPDAEPKHGLRIPFWNDAPERTFPEVKAAFERAIELAESLPSGR